MTPTTSEREARELLAQEFRSIGRHEDAYAVAHGEGDDVYGPSVRAIIAALTREQREGDDRIDVGAIDSGERPHDWDAVDEAMLHWYGHKVTFSQSERQRFFDAIQKYLRAQPQHEAQGAVAWCTDPECGCKDPTFTEPMEALRFLSGRMKYAGIGEAVARHYARDIDAILAKHTPPAPVDVRVREIAGLELACAGGRWAWFHHWGEAWDGNSYPTVREANLAKRAALLAALLDGQPAGVCPNCNGSGAEVRTVARCCGHAMSNGDCCGNPEPEEVGDPCSQCGGSGQAALGGGGGRG